MPAPATPPASQVSRPLFLSFVAAHPRALLLYLQQGLARLWRVAHFMLSDFLALTLHKAQQQQQQPAPATQQEPPQMWVHVPGHCSCLHACVACPACIALG